MTHPYGFRESTTSTSTSIFSSTFFNCNFNFSCNYESATGQLVVKHSYGVAETLWVAQVSFGCARGPYGWYEGFPWILYRIPLEVEYLLGCKGLYRIVQESCIWHIYLEQFYLFWAFGHLGAFGIGASLAFLLLALFGGCLGKMSTG